MKVATLHFEIDGEVVDFEIYNDGEIVVPSADVWQKIEDNLIAEEMGFETKDKKLMKIYHDFNENMFDLFKRMGIFPKVIQRSDLMLVVSTAHMSARDSLKFASSVETDSIMNELRNYGLLYIETDYGWIVYLPSDVLPSTSVRHSMARSQERERLSESFLGILDSAYNEGVLIVNFDCDGPALEGFETHDW